MFIALSHGCNYGVLVLYRIKCSLFCCCFPLLWSSELHPWVSSGSKEVTSSCLFSLGTIWPTWKDFVQDDTEVVICLDTIWTSDRMSRQCIGIVLICRLSVFETIYFRSKQISSKWEDLLRCPCSHSCSTDVPISVFGDVLVANWPLFLLCHCDEEWRISISDAIWFPSQK